MSVIRGGALRLIGLVLGTLASVAASAVVIRHLGVVDTGRFLTVMSLIAIAGSISDLGMSAVGVRDYAVRRPDQRRSLLRNLLGMRLTFIAAGIAVATGFSALAGYTPAMVVGTVTAGLGMALFVAQQSLAILFHVQLRFGTVAALALLGQVGVAIGAAILSLAGASLPLFFLLQIPTMIVVIAVSVVLGGHDLRILPAFDRDEWRRLLKRVLPYSAAVVLSVLYFRIAQIMVSLLSTPHQTGFFGVSFRVLDVLTGIPPLLASTALPVLATAAREDPARFASVARRLAEALTASGIGLVLAVFVGARFCIDLVAGPGFDESVDALRILAFALVGTFVIAARGYSLLALDRTRAILISNALTLAVVFAAGIPLISAHGATGGAITLLAAELTLGVCYEVALTRARPAVRMAPSFVARVAGAAVVAAAAVELLHLPSLAAAVAALPIYAGLLFAVRAVPADVISAFTRPRWRTGTP